MRVCTVCLAESFSPANGIYVGKSAPSAPAAPDPTTTSQAQTASNQATALYNFGLNNPDTTTPLGSLQFTTDTSNPNEPSTTENVTLSPAEQAIFDTNTANIQQQGANATTAQNNVTNLLQTPYNLAGNVSATPSQQNQQQDLQNTENALYQQQYQYLQPEQQQAGQQLQSQLADEGIPQGSQAYMTAMNNQALQNQQANQSALNSAISGGAASQAQLAQTGLANQAQQAQLYTQQYQEPLNLYSSLMSGTAPTMPQFQGMNASNAAPTNVLGAYQNSYQGQLNAYNTAVGSQNSQTAGLTGLGGALGAAGIIAASDRRLKKNIEKLGVLASGIPFYIFEYIGETTKHIGVMSDDVKKIIPKAVSQDITGYDVVHYGRLA